MRIAIVDDRAADRAELRAYLDRYCAESGLFAEYSFFPSAEALLDAFAPGSFDLLFLDIYMDKLTGMEAARIVSRADPLCRMIFFTTSHTHAVESYEVRAAFYLTKPLDYERLCLAMDTACVELRRDSRSLTLHCAGLPFPALFRDILFVDCAAERARVHLTERVVTIDERVSEVFPALLQDDRFLNCNRNVAVNMDHILSVQERDFLLRNQESVPIRQRSRGAVKKAFLEYSLRALRKENG